MGMVVWEWCLAVKYLILLNRDKVKARIKEFLYV